MRTLRDWWRVLAIASALWTLISVLFTANYYASRMLAGTPPLLVPYAAFNFLSFISFAWFTVPIGMLVERCELGRTGWRRHATILAAGAVPVLAAMAAWDALVTRALQRFLDLSSVLGPLLELSGWALFRRFFMIDLPMTLVTYVGTVAAFLAIAYHRRLRDREVRTAHLEAQLADARLQALQAQVQPHFLFNTLNGIAALVRANPDAAERMIVMLSDLLRATLSAGAAQEVPLRRELEVLHRYLEIERMRFPDRLAVGNEIGEGTLDAAVPTLILQPLVENAIRHGIAPRPGPGTVTVRSQRAGGSLVLEVADDGVGSVPARPAGDGAGLGLANTKARLRELYGRQASFALTMRPGGGATARIELPFRAAAGAAEAGG